MNLGGEYRTAHRASEESARKIDFHLDQIFVGTKKRTCNEEFVEKQLSSLLFFVAGTPRYFFALLVWVAMCSRYCTKKLTSS